MNKDLFFFETLIALNNNGFRYGQDLKFKLLMNNDGKGKKYLKMWF